MEDFFLDLPAAIMDSFQEIGSFFSSDLFSAIIFILKVLSGFFSLLIFIYLIIVVFQLRKRIRSSIDIVSESIGRPILPKQKISRTWEDIVKRVATGDENAYKMAVIEADKIFDDMLKKIGYEGKDMGERMKQIRPGQFTDLDGIWAAHKIRNSIVHDPDFNLTRNQADNAVKIFEKALRELQLI